MGSLHWRRNIKQILVIFAVACASQVNSQPVREFSLETVERLGKAIYEQDLVAWSATDILRAENKAGEVPDSEMAKIKGWIVVGTPEAQVVKFIADGEQGPYAVKAYAFYSDEKRATAGAARPPSKGALTEPEHAQFRARKLALEHVKRRCSDRLNAVVLQDRDGGGFLVYVLAATTVPNVMVVGGHYRFTVSPDGRQIVQTDELSRACLMLSLNPSDKHVVVSHQISNAPIETHVFLSLLHRMDIGVVVASSQTLWIFSKGKMVSSKKLQ